MSGWTKITEKYPDAGVGVLVTDGKIVTVAELDYKKGSPWWWDGHGFDGHEWEFYFDSAFSEGAITHWQPLPPPPEA